MQDSLCAGLRRRAAARFRAVLRAQGEDDAFAGVGGAHVQGRLARLGRGRQAEGALQDAAFARMGRDGRARLRALQNRVGKRLRGEVRRVALRRAASAGMSCSARGDGRVVSSACGGHCAREAEGVQRVSDAVQSRKGHAAGAGRRERGRGGNERRARRGACGDSGLGNHVGGVYGGARGQVSGREGEVAQRRGRLAALCDGRQGRALRRTQRRIRQRRKRAAGGGKPPR